MIFDLKSGKRRRVVQVVFGFLAFVFFISFVGFGIGSDVTGGIFDALGIGGGNSSGSDPQFEQQIEDAQSAVDANPKSGNAAADLIGAYYASATSSGISTDQQTGQVSISEGAHTDLQNAAQAWDDYIATKPKPVSVAAAASAVQVFQLLNEAGGAAEAQRVVADDQKSAAGYAQLAFYLYADLQIDEADAVAKQAVAASESTQRKQIEKSLQAYHDQAVKFQKQQEQQQRQQQQQGGGTGSAPELENPFGGLGTSAGGATTVPPTSP
jgi:hypothetical protein